MTGCTQPASKQGLAQLQMAEKYYQEQNTAAAVHILSNFIKSEPGSREIQRAYYLRGLCYHQMGYDTYEQARQDFNQALKGNPGDEIRALSYTGLGHTYFESLPPQYPQAIENYEQALKYLKDVSPKDAVLYRLGIALQRCGQQGKADQYLSQCFNTFPDSEYSIQARATFGASGFCVQLGAFGLLSNAETMIKKMKQSGYDCQWAARQQGGKLLYVVYYGRYGTFAEAEKSQQMLESKGFKCMVIPLLLPKEK